METYKRCLFKERKQTKTPSITITIQHSLSCWSKNADQKRKIYPLEFLQQVVLRHLDIRRRIKLDLLLTPRGNTEWIKGLIENHKLPCWVIYSEKRTLKIFNNLNIQSFNAEHLAYFHFFTHEQQFHIKSWKFNCYLYLCLFT